MAKKERIDALLVQRGLAASRDRAKRLLLAGKVLVDDTPVDKAGTRVLVDAAIRLRGEDHPYASRGGLKLAGALSDLSVEVVGLRCLDVGASTGGFTDCLLQRGATEVVAVDVGTNQLHNKLRQEPRVRSFEQTDIRDLQTDQLGGPIDLVVVDASFISLRLLLPPIARLIGPGTRVLALVKPQFEVGRELVGRGGVVKDDAVRRGAVDAIAAVAQELGFEELGRCESQVAGARSGNREVFLMVGLETQ
ncbi:MAG: TlyA family RNA methyltransferase [Deltaproteobacteria bacterium]|nr:TlyA family RNA methyltransferase [Deltaproteobacteria bacterium]